MTDMRRTLLWVVFTMSLFLLWDGWNKHNGKPSFFSPSPVHQPASAAGAAPGNGLPAPVAGGQPSAVPGAAASAPVAAQTVTVASDVVKATFDSRGGDLVRLELLTQKQQDDKNRNIVLFERGNERVYLAQTGLIGNTGALPNHLTVMNLLPGETTLKPGSDALSVVFESPEVGGVRLRKTYTLKRGDYVIGVTHEIINTGTAPVQPQLYLQLVRDGQPPEGQPQSSSFFSGPAAFTGPAMYTQAAHFQKFKFADIVDAADRNKPEHERSASDGWVAMVQHYFASAWMLADGVQRDYQLARLDASVNGVPSYRIAMLTPVGEIAPGASKKIEARLFAGPQEEQKLAALAPGLELVKDYGWFKILAEPLFWLLTQLHKLIGNWGWAIVALVVVLKAAFFWLNASAYRSMAKMKAINPKIQELRERLKDKPQQMQQEMMRIYREEKVNPIGGCLPILIQMPFFLALYWVLLSSVEMRNAPWIGWVTDLSVKDPLYILPAVMTASQLLQTWLNPTPPDPVQAKMMWIMPLVFSVMFFYFPAGLVLYWVTNNLLSIAQQWVINKKLGVAK
ncbi:MAG TPA: membrane protein insertase YidC [Methylibium sp.]